MLFSQAGPVLRNGSSADPGFLCHLCSIGTVLGRGVLQCSGQAVDVDRRCEACYSMVHCGTLEPTVLT